MTLDALNSDMIIGAKIYVCRIGSTTSAPEATLVSDTFHPTLPTSYDDTGDWTLLGGLDTAQFSTEYDTYEITRVLDDGVYHTTERKSVKKRNLKFTTPDITLTAFRLTFGLLEEITEEPQKAFASGNDSEEVWVYAELTDSYRAKNKLVSVIMRGTLSLENPLEAKKDVSSSQFDLSIHDNPLNLFNAEQVLNMEA